MTFGMLIEDPFYDEDGVLIDEDADWEDAEGCIEDEDVAYDPFNTVNS